MQTSQQAKMQASQQAKMQASQQMRNNLNLFFDLTHQSALRSGSGSWSWIKRCVKISNNWLRTA